MAESQEKVEKAEKNADEMKKLQVEILSDLNTVEGILKLKLKKKRAECTELIGKNNEIILLSKDLYGELQNSLELNISLKRIIKELKIELNDKNIIPYNKKNNDEILNRYLNLSNRRDSCNAPNNMKNIFLKAKNECYMIMRKDTFARWRFTEKFSHFYESLQPPTNVGINIVID